MMLAARTVMQRYAMSRRRPAFVSMRRIGRDMRMINRPARKLAGKPMIDVSMMRFIVTHNQHYIA